MSVPIPMALSAESPMTADNLPPTTSDPNGTNPTASEGGQAPGQGIAKQGGPAMVERPCSAGPYVLVPEPSAC